MCQTNLNGLLGTRAAKVVRRISIFSVLASAVIVASPLLDGGALFAQEEGIAVGSVAPNAALQLLDGRPVELNQFLGKKPVVMEFWATWCPVCKGLQPRIDAAIKKYGTQVTFITIAVSVNQTPARVAAWHKANPIATEMVYDANGKATGAYDPPATSYLVVVNKAGKVVYTGLGADQDVDGAIKKAMM
ncbi:MAG: redoxin domain-containing protein [Phycisphaerae bacterium]|nr:redoxin domain-containing protein [Gemmatimonadaceae bacterium]